MTYTKMGPLAPDHPLVTQPGLPCGRCLNGFEAGQYVTLDLLPPDEPEQQAKAAAGRPYRAEGLPVHWDCVLRHLLADDMCYCGRPLHYSQPWLRAQMDRIVSIKGRYIPVETPDGIFLVCRHYIALHGIKGRDVAKLGFLREPA